MFFVSYNFSLDSGNSRPNRSSSLLLVKCKTKQKTRMMMMMMMMMMKLPILPCVENELVLSTAPKT